MRPYVCIVVAGVELVNQALCRYDSAKEGNKADVNTMLDSYRDSEPRSPSVIRGGLCLGRLEGEWSPNLGA